MKFTAPRLYFWEYILVYLFIGIGVCAFVTAVAFSQTNPKPVPKEKEASSLRLLLSVKSNQAELNQISSEMNRLMVMYERLKVSLDKANQKAALLDKDWQMKLVELRKELNAPNNCDLDLELKWVCSPISTNSP